MNARIFSAISMLIQMLRKGGHDRQALCETQKRGDGGDPWKMKELRILLNKKRKTPLGREAHRTSMGLNEPRAKQYTIFMSRKDES